MDEAQFRDIERHREDLLDASYDDGPTDSDLVLEPTDLTLVCDECGRHPWWENPRVNQPCPDDRGFLVRVR